MKSPDENSSKNETNQKTLPMPERIGAHGIFGDLKGALKVLSHVSFSHGWAMLAVVAPLAWGFLPFGYGALKKVEEIAALPPLTVFMRMGCAAIASGLILLAWILLGKAFRPKGVPAKDYWFDVMWKETRDGVREKLCPLLLLPGLYVLARILEMELLLNYKPVGATETFTSALQEYGYFLGLLIVILIPARKPRNFSVTDMLVWICTLTMVLSGGVLNLIAREHVANWSPVGIMTGFAVVVAVVGFFSAMVKSASGLSAGYSSSVKAHGLAAPIFASMVVNAIMSFGATILAGGYIFAKFMYKGWEWRSYGDGIKYSLGDALLAYFTKPQAGYGLWLIVVIVLVGSVLAPVCQLAGIAIHDEQMRIRKLKKYGLSGRDWLIVSGGFEPMFVVLIGILYGSSFKSYYAITLSFGLVLAIALLRVVKIWSEKNAALRNAIFTNIRGSSRGPDGSAPAEALLARTEKLAIIKFYDKRQELKGHELSMSAKPVALDKLCEKHSSVSRFLAECKVADAFSGKEFFYAPLVGGEIYFTQDDPFTHDVVQSQFDWLGKANPCVKAISFSYTIKKFCSDSSPWSGVKGLKAAACGGRKDATPYLIIADNEDQAIAFCSGWNSLLCSLRNVVESEDVSQYMNAMMLNPAYIKE